MTDQLQLGPELDEAIAKLLGWKKLDETFVAYGFCNPSLDYWRIRDGSSLHLLPTWSTDNAEAIALLEQLCKPVEEGGKKEVHYYRISNCEEYQVELYDEEGYEKGFAVSKVSPAHAAALAIRMALEAEQ